MNTTKANMRASMGGFGGEIQEAGVYQGNYCAIKALTSSEVSTVGNIKNMNNITIPESDVLPGGFTQVTVISGKVVLYYNSDGE